MHALQGLPYFFFFFETLYRTSEEVTAEMANAPPRITAADVANTGSAFRKPFPGIVDCSWQLLQQKHTKLQTGISWLLETWKLEPTQEEKRRRLCWRTKWLELHLDTYHLIKLLKYTTNKIHKYKVPGMGLHMISIVPWCFIFCCSS